MNLADLKTRMRENMEQEKKNQADRAARTEIMQKLISAVEFELPPTAVEEETHATVYDIVAENQARGVPANVLEEKKDEIFTNAAKSRAGIGEIQVHRRANRREREDRRDQRADRPAPRLPRPARGHHAWKRWSTGCARTTPSALIRQQLLRQAVLDFLLKEAKFE